MGVVERLGALVMRALDGGYQRVQVQRAENNKPGALLLEQAEGAVAIEVDEPALGAEERTAFAALIARIDAAQALGVEVVVDPAWLEGQPIETLAREYLALRRAEQNLEAVRAQLLARMKAQGRTAIDVPGVGAVLLQRGTAQNRVDNDAVKALIESLAARLRALGEACPTPDLPRTRATSADGIKVAWGAP